MQMAEDESGTSRQLFTSYAREDLERVTTLKRGLERLHHQVWIDDRLSVGQEWWDEILLQIRRCDAVVVAVSPALIKSRASGLERTYARRLGKRILPVFVRPVSAQLLPPDLAAVQFVDYSEPGADAAFQLAFALNGLPPSPPLPDPLPEPPPVPVSYLSSLGEQVKAATLTLDEQFAIVARLRDALAEPEEREDALSLLRALDRRVDLYHAPARQISEVLAQQQGTGHGGKAAAEVAGPDGPVIASRTSADNRRSTSGTEPSRSRTLSEQERRSAAAGVPEGWYPDPTGRHRLRWFDGDWSDWASDGGPALLDIL
jgi:hypothetical protein